MTEEEALKAEATKLVESFKELKVVQEYLSLKEAIANDEELNQTKIKAKEKRKQIALSDNIQDITVKGFSTIDFIIGGTTGLEKEFVAISNLVLSFSKLTFPHQLIRLFLSEQIFRAFKIMNNERYHW